MMAKDVKVGVERGGGPAPGYLWNVFILDLAFEEAMGFLNEDQYQHISMQFKELARENDPSHSQTGSVDAIDDFHELRDKGGILGGMNVRVFFCLDKSRSAIVVLGACKKQNDGPTPLGVKKRIARRLRKYLNGDYGVP
jgi:hypothetical protein